MAGHAIKWCGACHEGEGAAVTQHVLLDLGGPGPVFFFVLGALDYLLLHGNKSRYFEM